MLSASTYRVRNHPDSSIGEVLNVKVEILKSKCQAYGNCADEAPELFRLDDAGYADVIGSGTVPDDHVGAAQNAALSCPAQAIVVRD